MEKGQKFRVIGRTDGNECSYHHYNIGDEVEFVKVDEDGDLMFIREDGLEQFLVEKDIEPIE